MDEIILAKCESVERCFERIAQESEKDLATNQSAQDALILNIQRACQCVIDIGHRILRVKAIAIPKTTREIFESLEELGIISSATTDRMKKMVGFRNIAVHEYQQINLDILESVIKQCPNDFRRFVKEISQTL